LDDRQEDVWLAWDKLQHFVGCGLAALVTFWLAQRLLPAQQQTFTFKAWLAFLFSFVIGLGKEYGDYAKWWPGDPSYKDLAADVLGAVLAIAGLVAWERCAPQSSFSGGYYARAARARFIDLELGLVNGHSLRRAILARTGADTWPWLQRLAEQGKPARQ